MGYVKTTANIDEKKCPFLYDETHIVSDCLKEKCHLWLEDVSQCSIPVLARQALGRGDE